MGNNWPPKSVPQLGWSEAHSPTPFGEQNQGILVFTSWGNSITKCSG